MTCYHVSLRMLNSFKRVVMALICSEWSQIDFKRLAFPVQLRQIAVLASNSYVFFTMRAWPVARSIFDAPSLCERSERADNKLDNVF